MFLNGLLVNKSDVVRLNEDNIKHKEDFLNNHDSSVKITNSKELQRLKQNKKKNNSSEFFNFESKLDSRPKLVFNLDDRIKLENSAKTIKKNKLIKKNSSIQELYQGFTSNAVVFNLKK